MTSGNFASVEIASIFIDRAVRQRRELRDIPMLAASIAARGLINPIIIERSALALVAGERRLEAARSLGWTHITVQWAEDLDQIELHLIELEENTKRVDLDWKDQCRAVEEYHRLQSERDPEWNKVRTGEALGISNAEVKARVDVAKALSNPRVASAAKYSVARNIVEREQARKVASATEALRGTTEAASLITTISFNEWAPGYDGPKFNFLHCDFPYGIGANKFNQGGAGKHGGYEDTPQVYAELLETLAGNAERLLGPSAHIMFWFSMEHYAYTYEFLSQKVGFVIDPFPLVWHKSDNVGTLPDPNRGGRRTYETCFFGHRGDRKIVQAVAMSVAAPTYREEHMSEKPEEMLRHFFRMIVDEHTSMLDPTCGSGSALRAARSLGGKVAGLEMNPQFAEDARRRL